MLNLEPAPVPLNESDSAVHLDKALPPHGPSNWLALGLAWIPIRSLAEGHRARILAHLCALPESDRYLRFGYQASDEQIGRYVDGLNFDRDEVFGVFNRRLELVALAHLACPSTADSVAGSSSNVAEFGGSVLGRLRGRGYGTRLFEHAMLRARNRAINTLFIHALSENLPMLRIAKQAGAIVQRDGPESEAYLQLPPETMASHLEQAFNNGAAELDYRLKQQAHFVDVVAEAISDVRSSLRGSETSHRD